MCETEFPCTCSKSQPGVRGQCNGPLGAFVTYCNISCFQINFGNEIFAAVNSHSSKLTLPYKFGNKNVAYIFIIKHEHIFLYQTIFS